jgi:RNA recognition motif-containing protein
MRLFICNLAWEATADDLKRWLIDTMGYTVGEVKVIMHSETGRSRGFGFADFPNEVQGQDALQYLNGVDFLGRTLKVNLAVRRESSDHRGSSDSAPRGDRRGSDRNERRDGGSSRRRDRHDDEWKW